MALTKAQAIIAVYNKLEELMGAVLPDEVSDEVLEGIEQSWTDLATSIAEVIDDSAKTRCDYWASSTQNLTTGNWDIIKFATKLTDNINDYNPTTGFFTAPEDGLYHVDTSILLSSGTWTAAGQGFALAVLKNKAAPPTVPSITTGDILGPRWACQVAATHYASAIVSKTFDLTAADTLSVWGNNGSGSTKYPVKNAHWSWLSIERIG